MSNRNGERGKFESISKSHIFDCHKETLQLKTRRHFINLSRAETFPSNGSSINFSINSGLTVETVRVKLYAARFFGNFILMDFYIWQNELNMDLVILHQRDWIYFGIFSISFILEVRIKQVVKRGH